MDEIVNRVKESGLISMDLATFKPKAEIVSIDVADVLWQRLVLKEKDFRSWITSHDWTVYKNKAVYVHCSEDAIVPTWAYMLIGSQLGENTPDYIIGSKIDLEKRLIQKRIESEPLDAYIDGRIIIKGCADISSPEFAMSELVRHLQPVVKSIMYGEPCSTVPVYKRKK
ncbi:MAG: DUF2480 family protein [Crocinitomicaceae bacterium]